MRVPLLLAALAVAPTPSSATVLFATEFAGYAGAGIAPAGAGGTLDSSRWTVAGLSEGTSAPGDSRLGGDFGRGRSPGGVSAGGLYAFEIAGAAGGVALGLQPTSSDLTPGSFTLHLVHAGPETLEGLSVDYDLFVRNAGGRSTAVRVELGLAGGWTSLPALALDTPGRAAPGAGWELTALAATVDGLTLAPATALAVRWLFDDLSGSGSRDEIALDRVVIGGVAPTVDPPDPIALGEPGAIPLLVAAAAALSLRRRHRRVTNC